MNWKQIKKDCPKAWKLLCEAHSTTEVWGYIDHPDVWDMDGLEISHYELRHLFDFFDEQGLYIYIHPSIMPTDAKYCTYSILQDDRDSMSSIYTENRKATEKTAFIKAFQILEKQSL